MYKKRSFGTLERGYDKERSVSMSQRHSKCSYNKMSVEQHFSRFSACLPNAKKLNIIGIH